MNICEYQLKKDFFDKVEEFREDCGMNIVDALRFLGIRKSAYYKRKKTLTISSWVFNRLRRNQCARKVFTTSDFERIW